LDRWRGSGLVFSVEVYEEEGRRRDLSKALLAVILVELRDLKKEGQEL